MLGAIERPDIIISDAVPLNHLAQAGALAVLHQVGRRAVVVDMAAFEATQDFAKPGAAELRDWLAAGRSGADGEHRRADDDAPQAPRVVAQAQRRHVRYGRHRAATENQTCAFNAATQKIPLTSENGETDGYRVCQHRDMDLDHDARCRAVARDVRFDGRLFVRVQTTGI